MCPFCLATIGLIVAGATSAGGLTALAVKLSRKKNVSQEIILSSSESSITAGTAESGLTGIATQHADAR